MALVACSECKKEISDSVKACPNCGYKKSGWSFLKVMGFVTLLFFIGKCSSESSKTIANKPAERTPQQIESDAKFSRNVGMLKAFKRTLHNPDSFKIESVLRMADDTLCVQYRATNRLNAVVLSQIAILNDGKVDLFNAHCAGKSGENITYIKRAL